MMGDGLAYFFESLEFSKERPQTMMQTEITREEALLALLSNEKYSDITLKGTDGSLVRANRAILAARSPVFDSMLYGDFAEAHQSVVDVGYNGETLQDVVDYIYTDEVPIFDDEQTSADDSAQKVLSLMDGATYFALPELCRRAQAVAIAQTEKKASLCVAYFAACETYGALVADSKVEESVLEKIRSNPKILLEEGVSLASLSSSRIEKILKDTKVLADEFTLFQILQAWAEAWVEGSDHTYGTELSEISHQSRKRTASQLIQHIALEGIDPGDLSTTVKTSGLVTSDQLLNAYETQALLAKQKHGMFYKKLRAPALWKSSNDVTFIGGQSERYSNDVLHCPALTCGIHKWSILVEEMTSQVFLGVASTVSDLDQGKFLGQQAGGWVYGGALSGNTYHKSMSASSDGHPKFRKGSKLTFILDLTGKGALSASVDGKTAVQLFSNMHSAFEDMDTKGFVPAASIWRDNGRVRFLGFE
jgi:hypothetical protein